jgi:hypothetical protein
VDFDPSISLAVSLNAHKGVYALLLGSGVSKSAGIPTGWDVVLDLIRRVALLAGEDIGEDAVAWYRKKFGKVPDYSELVQTLAATPAERTSLLKEYFEPTEQEREDGMKLPTPAHQAIARLVTGGYVKVIITTNFDRLLERSLEAEGVSPTVVSSPDHIAGMLPLPHVRCLVFKVHGDYLDTRIKNTPKELATYDSESNRLLDRILSEFGLLVCGWSGEWDTALADAIIRNNHFRFSTYWLAKGKPAERATDLIKHRQATLLSIDSADAAFVDLQAKVESLASRNLVDPMSPRLAVATIKRFLSEPKYRIQLEDAVVNELEEVRRQTNLKVMPIGSPEPDKVTYVDRVRKIEAICSKLVPMVATGAYWDNGELDNLWKRCVETLARSDFRSGHSYNAWSRLQYYPATLVVYAVGIAAILRRRFSLLRVVLVDAKAKEYGRDSMPAVGYLGTWRCFQPASAQLLHASDDNDQPGHKTPGSDWVVARMELMLQDVIGSDINFANIFDEMEFVVALVCADLWCASNLGRFAWRRSEYSESNELVKRTESELQEQGDKHHLLQAGLFRGEKDRLTKALATVKGGCREMEW